MKRRESGFILLYSMLLVLCLSGFSFYLVQQYEMERSLLSHELEETQVKQLTYSVITKFVENLPADSTHFSEQRKTKYGETLIQAVKKNELWEVNVTIFKSGYTKQRTFTYNEQGGIITAWKERSP